MSQIIPIFSDDTRLNLSSQSVEETYTQYTKDWIVARSMMSLSRNTRQHNLTELKLDYVERKTKLVLALLPCWGIIFAPYNLARLSAITKSAGYDTTVFDVNVKAWQRLKDATDSDLWNSSKDWVWRGKNYMSDIHPLIEPILKEYIQKIVDAKPDVVGFSVYYTNESPTNWVTLYLKKLLPNTKFIIGGPQTLAPLSPITKQIYDHIIKGEGEQSILNLLDQIEKNNTKDTKIVEAETNTKDTKILVAETNRLDLDSLPLPDYSHFDFNDYLIPNGISLEFTRGCVAKCSFCTETHFWKYRGRVAADVLEEVKYHYKKYGPVNIWFIDSLINGNINELRAFALGVIEERLVISYFGNSRIDGRMDFEYLQDLAMSGCKLLQFGVESGSQKVLNDMKKMITPVDIEQNLKDVHLVGIDLITNWMMGFPSEDSQAFADTLALFCRVARYHDTTDSVIQVGSSLTPGKGSELGDHPELFNIDPDMFEQAWTTTGLTNTKLHRLVRQKTWIMLVQQFSKKYKFNIDRADLTPIYKSYTIKYVEDSFNDNIPNMNFDYNIINSGLGTVADSIMNQIWPVLHILWRSHGAYELELKFDPSLDSIAFGDMLGGDYFATHKFIINQDGEWTADFAYLFKTKYGQWKGIDHSFNFKWQGHGDWKSRI